MQQHTRLGLAAGAGIFRMGAVISRVNPGALLREKLCQAFMNGGVAVGVSKRARQPALIRHDNCAQTRRVQGGDRVGRAGQEPQLRRRGYIAAWRGLDVDRAVPVEKDGTHPAEIGSCHGRTASRASGTWPPRPSRRSCDRDEGTPPGYAQCCRWEPPRRHRPGPLPFPRRPL